MGASKSISNLKVHNLIQEFGLIKVESVIKDQPRPVKKYHYCRSRPKVRNQPKLIGLSKQMIQQLGLNYQEIKKDPEAGQYFSGAKLLPNSDPVCNNYCGFQFGVWAGQLGDGRAHTIGHIIQKKRVYELQLKGSGRTPFSRHADGNSVVSSALRQFLASQLLYGLRIPTTRAASIAISRQDVVRDPYYNGNLKVENAAIVLRICQSFLRFGSVQVCIDEANMTDQNPLQNRKTLLPLFDYLVQNCYPDISSDQGDPYELMFKIIVQKTAQLVAYWQSIGFVHGVLNTDNMSMVNVTIDYGPFAFIDYFSKDYVSNATDQHQRYSYRRQPQIVKWNLLKLAQAMDPIVPSSVLKKFVQERYQGFHKDHYYFLMHQKLGLQNNNKNNELIDQLFEVMDICSSHFTNIFRIFQNHLSNQKKYSSQQMIEQILKDVLNQSCPTQFYLKNLRVYPMLVGKSYDQILQHDSGFNIYFLKQQQKRMKIYQTLRQENCKERYQREKTVWREWLSKYISLQPHIKHNTCPKYVLLNEIAKKINAELVQIKDNNESIQYMEKILGVFYKPYEKNQWFEEKFWKLKPTPVKLTCSS